MEGQEPLGIYLQGISIVFMHSFGWYPSQKKGPEAILQGTFLKIFTFFLAVPLTWGFIGAQGGGQVASEAGELKAQAGACDSSSAGRNGCFWRFLFLRKKATWSLGVDFFLKIL